MGKCGNKRLLCLHEVIVPFSHLVNQNIKVCVCFIRLHPSACVTSVRYGRRRVFNVSNKMEMKCDENSLTFNKFELACLYKLLYLLFKFYWFVVEPTTEVRSDKDAPLQKFMCRLVNGQLEKIGRRAGRFVLCTFQPKRSGGSCRERVRPLRH